MAASDMDSTAVEVDMTSTDLDALLTFAREHEPELWEALTDQCDAGTHYLSLSKPERGPDEVCRDCNEPMYGGHRGRVPLPPAEAQVALEAWCQADGITIAFFAWGLCRVSRGPSFNGDGDTLAAAVLAALEAK